MLAQNRILFPCICQHKKHRVADVPVLQSDVAEMESGELLNTCLRSGLCLLTKTNKQKTPKFYIVECPGSSSILEQEKIQCDVK